MRTFVSVMVGERPESARPLLASDNKRVIAATIRAILAQLNHLEIGTGLCSECKWWGEYEASGWGECERLLQPTSQVDIDPATHVNQDGGAERSTMDTQPDFGCVQFEPKT